MYSFKYHLVTICAVFLALAIGLLLGAAIGGSGLLTTTTSDLVDSLFDRYSNLSTQNSELSLQSEQYQSLSGAFVDKWDDDKLTGKDVLIVAGTSGDDISSSNEVASYIESAGGRYVTVRVAAEAFGTDDAKTLAALQAVVPSVEGTDYSSTLAQALVAEWTSGSQADDVFDGGSLSSADDMSDSDKAAYPVTACLLQNGIVTIENSSHMPDTIDACVNLHVEEVEAQKQGSQAAEGDDTQAHAEDGEPSESSSSPAYAADVVSAQIGYQFWSKGAPVVFTQILSASTALMDEASNLGVSGVSSCNGTMGRYSIVSLLSSRTAGVYGPDRDSSMWYPAL